VLPCSEKSRRVEAAQVVANSPIEPTVLSVAGRRERPCAGGSSAGR
jgi:hypothetical protein